MEFVKCADDGPEPISIERCRELLGEEAAAMTDQEIALIRRHAQLLDGRAVAVVAFGGHCSGEFCHLQAAFRKG